MDIKVRKRTPKRERKATETEGDERERILSALKRMKELPEKKYKEAVKYIMKKVKKLIPDIIDHFIEYGADVEVSQDTATTIVDVAKMLAKIEHGYYYIYSIEFQGGEELKYWLTLGYDPRKARLEPIDIDIKKHLDDDGIKWDMASITFTLIPPGKTIDDVDDTIQLQVCLVEDFDIPEEDMKKIKASMPKYIRMIADKIAKNIDKIMERDKERLWRKNY